MREKGSLAMNMSVTRAGCVSLILMAACPSIWASGIGTFYPAGTVGDSNTTYDVVLADFTGDDACDIFAVNDGANVLYVNGGHGGFSASSRDFGSADSRGASSGDLNGDGYLDLVVANDDAVNEVWINDGSGVFTKLAQPGFTNVFYSQAVKLSDLDGDGDLDMFVAKSATGFGLKSRVYANDGMGVFSEISQTSMSLLHSYDVLLQDMDQDGDVDALLGNNGDNAFLQNDGAGHFSSYASEPYNEDSMHLAGGDVNNDGAMDFVAANSWPGPCRLYINKNNGTGTSASEAGLNGEDATGVALADVNSDGLLDIILADWGGGSLVLTNGGDGTTYGYVGQPLSTNNNQQVQSADLNGDGTPDLVFANYGAPNEVWFNAADRLMIVSTNYVPLVDDGAASLGNGTAFGTVGYASSVTSRFYVINLGLTDLVVNDVATSGVAATSFLQSGLPVTLAPFAKTNLNVVFCPEVVGACDASLRLAVVGEASAFVMNLSGTGRKADQKITFINPGTQIWTNQTTLAATSDSGLPVSYRLISGPAVLESSNVLSYTDTGNVRVAADQEGNGYYNQATSVSNTFAVAQAQAVITLYDLNQVYSGSSCAVTATTTATSGGMTIYYSGDDYVRQTNPPVYAGAYDVLAVQNTAEWYGQTTGTLVIAKAPQSITTFTPASGVQCTTNMLSLSAVASSGLTVTNIQWVSGPGVLSGTTLTFTNSGTVAVRSMQKGNSNWQATPWATNLYTVEKAVATVTLSNTQQVYNGQSLNVTATTVPSSVRSHLNITYNGVSTLPLNAGDYLVQAELDDPLWQGKALTTLQILPANPGLSWSVVSSQVATSAVTLQATSKSSGTIGYTVVSGAGSLSDTALTFTGDGAVVVAVEQASTSNYVSSIITQQFTVVKAAGTITPTQTLTSKMYDGQPAVIPYTTTPVSGMNVQWIYNGSTNLPSNVGTYAATGTLVNALYQGTVSTAFAITQAVQTIDFSVPESTRIATSTVELAATATSGLDVSFYLKSGPGLVNGSYLTFTGAGDVVVRAVQSGSSNWCTAADVLRTVHVAKAVASVSIGNLSQVYDGTAKAVTVTTLPSGLTTSTTYGGLSRAPTNGGSYAVTSTIHEALYCGTNTATLTVTKAAQSITFTNAGWISAVFGTALDGAASSGLDLTYAIVSMVPSNEQNYAWITDTHHISVNVTSLVSEIVVAASQPGNESWQAASSVTNVFLAMEAVNHVTLGDLSATYDGQPHAAAWSCTNASVTNVVVYYDGSERSDTNPPTTGGTYPVWAVIEQPDYAGGAVGDLVIAQMSQTVAFVNCPTNVLTTNEVTLSATASSGLEPALSLLSGPGVLSGAVLTFTNSGAVQIQASQAGNENYLSASMTRMIQVAKTPASLSFADNTLTQTYTSAKLAAQITTIPADLAVVYTYNGKTSQPVAVGAYAVTGTVNDVMYKGSLSGVMTVTKAVTTVNILGSTGQIYNGSSHVVTATTDPAISGSVAFTYNGSATAPTNAGSYSVTGIVSDVSYAGTSTVTMVIAKAAQTISAVLPTNMMVVNEGTSVTWSATASSGLSVQCTNLNADAPIEWISANTFRTYAPGDVELAYDQPGNANWDAAPTIIQTVVVQAVTGTFYVAMSGDDTNDGMSWDAPKQTIQAALDCAVSRSTVFVSNGIYATGGRVADGQSLTNRVIIHYGVSLKSVNGASVTTIRGQAGTGADAPLGSDAVRCVYASSNAAISGFTLEQGGTMAGDAVSSDVTGGGCYVKGMSVIDNCIFQQNNASFGGALGAEGVHFVIDSLFTDNFASQIGGAGYRSLMIGCTAYSNSAVVGAGGIAGASSNDYAIAANSIVYGNTPNDANAFVAAMNSCLASTNDLLDSTGCITNAPLFVDASSGNAALQPASPCINRGVNTFQFSTNDLAGNTRVVFDVIDMGAYEYAGIPPKAVDLTVSSLEPWQFDVSWQNGSLVPVTNLLTMSNATEIVLQQSMTNATSLTVTNIMANETYYITVVPQNSYGDAPAAVATTHTPKADQIIRFTQQGAVNAFDGVTLDATVNSGLDIAYTITSFSPSNAQNRCWLTNGNEIAFSVTNLESTMTVAASQAGNTQWNPAASVTNTFLVYPAFSRVTVTNLAFTYDATAHAPGWSCTNQAVTNVVFYYGTLDERSTGTPVNAGAYSVYAVIKQADIKGGGMATLTVARASQQIHDFNLPETALTTNVFTLSADSSEGQVPVTFRVTEGNGTLRGDSLSFSGDGTVSVLASQAGNSNYLSASQTKEVTVNKTPVTSMVWTDSSLSQVYSGNRCYVYVTTDPSDLSVNYLYDGSSSAPRNAGSYAVTATVDDDIYSGVLTGTLTVSKASPVLIFTNPGDQLTTNQVALSMTSDSPESVGFSVVSGPAVVSGSSLTFTNAGYVTIMASQATGSNWLASASNVSFAVSKAVAPITISNTNQVYDGSSREVTVTTVPEGLSVDVTYDGSTTAPVNASDVAVVAAISATEPMYAGSASTVLHIARGDQEITFPEMGSVNAAIGLDMTASAASSLPVTYQISSFDPSNTMNRCWLTNDAHVAFSVTNPISTMAVVARQAGNTNWNAAADVEQTFWIYREFVDVQLDGLQVTYDGTSHVATWTCSNAAVTNVTLYYNGIADEHTNGPINAGTYPVTARINQPDIWGGARGEMVIAKATQSVVNFSLPVSALTTNQLTLSAESSVGLTGSTFRLISGPGMLDGTSLTFTNAGEVGVEALLRGNSNYVVGAQTKTVMVSKTPVNQLVLDTHSLTQAYTGAGIDVTATSDPVVQSMKYLYDNDTNLPVNVGEYAVQAVADDPMYSGSAVGLLTIVKADPSIGLVNPGAQLITNAVSLAATSDCPLAISFAITDGPGVISGNSLTFTNAAEVTLAASQAGDTNWNAAVTSVVFSVSKIPASIQFLATQQVYNGASHAVTATTDPLISGDVVFTYDGSSIPPTQAGSYSVTGVIHDVTYAGTSTVTMVVFKAAQTISMILPTNSTAVDEGLSVTWSAEATSGFSVQCTNLNADAPIEWIANDTFRTYAPGEVQLVYSQTGDVNWAAATQVVHTVTVVAVTGTFYVAKSGDDRNDGMSWLTPKQTIQAALDCTSPHSEVWVSNGVYATGGRVVDGQLLSNRVVVPPEVSVYSVNGAAVTTIRGQAGTGVNAPLGNDAVRCAYLSTNGLLQGFTLEQGSTLAGNTATNDVMGGGVFSLYFARANQCIIQSNHAAFGGGMAGSDVYFGIDSLITDNTASKVGGGVYAGALLGCTLSGNTAAEGGGIGGVSTNDPAVMINTIAYANGPRDVNDFVYAGYSCLSETSKLMAASYCITNAPLFVDSTNGDFSLMAASPCINAGSNKNAYNTNDLIGNMRIVFDVVDMGAYEYAGAPADLVNLTVSSLESWQFNVSWQNGGNVPVTNYFLTISNTTDVLVQQPMGDRTNFALTNAVANTDYFVSVIPQNIYGVAAVATVSAHTPQAEQTIAFTQQGAVNAYDGITLDATAASGLEVTYTIASFVPSNAQNRCWFTNGNEIAFSVTNLDSTLKVVASQVGNTQWKAAPSVTNTFFVYPTFSQVTLSNLAFTYDAMPHSPSWSCTNTAVTNVVLYYGDVEALSTNAPVNAGSYLVSAVIKQADIMGGGVATMTVARAAQQIQDFNLPETALTTNVITLSAMSSAGLTPVMFNVSSGTGSISDDKLSFTAAGTVAVQASQAGSSNYLSASQTRNVSVSKTPVQSVAWVASSLSQVYSGSGLSVSATTDPTGISLVYLYEGSSNAPVNAGFYAVNATVNDAMYSGMITGTLTVARAAPILAFTNPGDQLTTNQLTLAATSPSPVAVAFSVVSGPAVVNGSLLTFTNAGNVVLSASQTAGTNWMSALSNVSFEVSKAVAPVAISNTNQVYTGRALAVSVTTVPAGLPVDITYDGLTAAPTNGGDYAVTARIANSEPMYQGSSTTTLHIASAPQIIDFPNPGQLQAASNVVVLTATASSGLPVTNFYVVSCVPSNMPDCCRISTSNTLHFSTTNVLMTVQVAASQAGNSNWQAAPAVTNEFLVFESVYPLVIQNTNQVYAGIPRTVNVVNEHPLLTNITVTYDGSTNPPTHVGAYIVVAQSRQTNVVAFGMSKLHISKAPLTITADNVALKYKTWPPVFTATCQGFVNSETTNVFAQSILFDIDATETSKPGRYVIEPYNATAADYTISFVDGVLTIRQPGLSFLMLLLD
ncbi:MAG: VCBS repeat-containing protein [Spartobacteria bacterium]|nr:VCBS repeat-containing protein [Spartobacteria bacterium]